MRQLIAGNWKMHGRQAALAPFAAALREAAPDLRCDLLVCPPALYLAAMAEALAGSAVATGGQDCRAGADGAHTGDVSAAMLADCGARYVILGHSERRAYYGESDASVRAKVVSAIEAGLTPVVCAGESEAEHEAGRQFDVVGRHLARSLPDHFTGVVAYEPIWAIGTGKVPTGDDVAAMHSFIRTALVGRFGDAGRGMLILYGGSVKPDNASSLLGVPEVGGALIGGASLAAESFLAIARAAAT